MDHLRTPQPDGKDSKQPPPGVSLDLAPNEVDLLVYGHENPDNFVAMLMPAAQVGLGFADIPTPRGLQRHLTMQVVIMIPPGILPPDTSAILDPKTKQPMASKRLQMAFPPTIPPVVRTIIRKTALAPEVQAAMAAARSAPGTDGLDAPDAPPLPGGLGRFNFPDPIKRNL